MTRIIRIGHRGAGGYEPENTLRSFSKALELGADMIELDVHLSSDNSLVVIHDDTLDRTTNGQGPVSEKSFDELRALDAGKSEKIPSLAEAFDLILGKSRINIELKGAGTARPVAALIEEYVKNRGRRYEDFLVSSFDHLDLWTLKNDNPAILTGALAVQLPPGFAEFAKEMKAYSVNAALYAVSKPIIDELHKKEIKVFVFTVNEPEDIGHVKAMGIDGIFSDYPDRI